MPLRRDDVMVRFAAIAFGILLVSGSARAEDLLSRLWTFSTALTYDVTVDDAARSVHIVGGLGPGLGESVSRALEDHRIDTVTIDSGGGSIGEALAAAQAIERRGDLTVIARRRCVSACLPILLAGRTRLADADLTLQFHAPVLLPPLPAGAPIPPDVPRYYAFLADHGAPRDVLDKMRAVGPAMLFPVPAIDLVQSGVLTALLDGDRREPLPLAKWLYVERSPKIERDDPSFATLLTAIRSAEPDAVDRRADPLYQALTHNLDPATALHAEADRLRVQAIDSADPMLVVADLRAVQRQAEALRRLHYWRTCDQLVLRIGDPVFRAAAPDAIAPENGALAIMIAAAGGARWKARPLPADAEATARRVVEDARRQPAADGIGAKATEWQSVCETHVRLNDALLALDPDDAAAAARWLNHNPWPAPGQPHP